MGIIELSFEFPFGADGENSSTDSCLFRLYSMLANSGKPVGTINYISYDPRDGRMFILGSLCYSPRRHLLFFPGFSADLIETFNEHSDRPIISRYNFPIDHFTLEPSFTRWHITPNAPERRVKKLKVYHLSQKLIHWFSVSIRDEEKLEEAKRFNRLSFECPEIDAQRRLSELKEAIEGAIFQITRLHDECIPRRAGEFLHFDFWLDLSPTGRNKPQCPLRVPTSPNVVDLQMPLRYEVPVRLHRVRLKGFPGTVAMVASKHKGNLKYKQVITSAR